MEIRVRKGCSSEEERDRFLSAVHEGLADAEAGRTITDEELGARLDDLFGPLESADSDFDDFLRE